MSQIRECTAPSGAPASPPPLLRSPSQQSIHLTMLALSPCSTLCEESPENSVTVILPDMVTRKQYSIRQIEQFVLDHVAPPSPRLQIAHLMVFIFSQNLDDSISNVSEMRLLHMGRLYDAHSPHDFYRMPYLDSVAGNFAVFQLLARPSTISTLPANIGEILHKLLNSQGRGRAESVSSVTYADAMIRIIRKASRKLSVSLAATARSTTNDSTTDISVEEKPKRRVRWRRAFGMKT